MLLLVLVVALANCTFTTTKSYEPVFKDSNPYFSTELNNVAPCEQRTFNGKKITTNNYTNTLLEITIVNGPNNPKDIVAEKSLATQIAGIVKNNLKDGNQYNTYTVIFKKQIKTDSGSTSTSAAISIEKQELY